MEVDHESICALIALYDKVASKVDFDLTQFNQLLLRDLIMCETKTVFFIINI